MADLFYNSGREAILDGSTTDWANDSIGALLVTSSYTFLPAHKFVSDITNELSGGGYARVTLANKSVTNPSGTNVGLLADDITFSSLGAAAGTPSKVIVYDNTATTDAARRLISAVNITSPPTPDGSDYVISWDATYGCANMLGGGMYTIALERMAKRDFVWSSGAVGALLVDSSHSHSSADETVSDISANELSGGGYARVSIPTGRSTFTWLSFLYFSPKDGGVIFSSLGAAAGTPDTLILYENSATTDTARHLICQCIISAPVTPDGGDYAVTFDSAGDTVTPDLNWVAFRLSL